MTDDDRARRIARARLAAEDLLDAMEVSEDMELLPSTKQRAAYATAGLTVAMLHAADEFGRLADAIEQQAIPVQRTRGGTGPRCD